MSDIENLKTRFVKELAPKLMKELGIKNTTAVPKLTKITLNIGLGTYKKTHGKDIDNVVENLGRISGQKPIETKAKKAISNFKVRDGDVIGTSVTIRGHKMYDFVNKLVNVVFPRVRDFQGISPKSFDGNGNYSIGFKEHTVFPEISPDDISKLHGVEICIATTANTNEEGLALLKALGFPFKK